MQSSFNPEPAIYINDRAGLQQLVQQLLKQSILAVDTESNSLFAYQEHVCLIQFSTPEQDFLLDPLAISDLEPLGTVFQNPKIEKVFHAAEYDLLCMRRDYQFEFNNVFDSMLAARILGRNEVGLGSLLQSEFGIEVDKRLQRADWGKRPLPESYLKYAQLDTHYLIQLRNMLYSELEVQNLLSLAKEDFNRMCGVSNHNCQNHREDCWKINGSHDLSPEKMAVLNELCRYRDRVARSLDRPLFKVIGDNTLVQIADRCPLSIEELSTIHGMTGHQIGRHGHGLLQAVRRGLEAEPIYPIRTPRPSQTYLNRLDMLRNWRKNAALKMGVQSDVVLPKDLLMEIAEKNPTQYKELSLVLIDTPWRMEHFGNEILVLLQR